MLSASLEARQVRLENNRNILPAKEKGIIRYDAENTIVVGEELQGHTKFQLYFQAVKPGWPRQTWFQEIRMLQVGILCLDTLQEPERGIWVIAKALNAFGDLKQ